MTERTCLDCPKKLPNRKTPGRPRLRCVKCSLESHRKRARDRLRGKYVPTGYIGGGAYGRVKRETIAARAKTILDLWNSGEGATSLAQRYGVSRARIYQILASFTLDTEAARR